MTPDEFDACFDRFTRSTFRLEGLPQYLVDEEQPRVRAFVAGEVRPERSVRTNAWLARVARTSIVDGKTWQRVHVVDEPLTDYMRYELAAYVESQAAGEQIRILRRDAAPAALPADFWLFDADTPDAFAVEMLYDPDGRWLGAEHTVDPGVLDHYRTVQRTVWETAEPLNAYLATAKAGSRA